MALGMVHFVRHDGAGNIIGTGICSRKNFLHKITCGDFLIESNGNERENKIVDGKVVKKSVNEIKPIPAIKENVKPILRIFQEDWDALVARVEALENA